MPQVIVLGSGTSTGIPLIGCHCPVCTSTDPHDQRLRTSILLKTRQQKNILIDTTPDLRTQLLQNKIEQVDAAIITHTHADHLHGIDDLRPLGFKQNTKIPLYTDAATAQTLQTRFSYIFTPPAGRPLGGGIPRLALQEFKTTYATQEFCQEDIVGEAFTFFSLPHGRLNTNAIIYDQFAYLTDIQDVRPSVIARLQQQHLQLLIIECLQPWPHDTHLGLAKTKEVIAAVNPARVGLIHMAHSFGHQQLTALMAAWRPNVFPLYDQQVLTWD
ncbi:MAG: MBL fold metallo-hydrolase [Bacteriovoracaceae bacterium]|nr:MBL fold metallo-hydrolase [Bacteriovoracaceae bacterium]